MTYPVLAPQMSRQRSFEGVLMPHLRRVRRVRAFTQAELAKRAGVSRATVIALESGRDAWPSTVRRLARALGVKPEVLTGQSLES